jgi:Beta-ketoacyl synthase, N-terminal domain
MADTLALKDASSRALFLRSVGFAAIVRGPALEETFGAVAGEDVLPKAMRRRMSVFDLGVARCVIGLAGQGVDEDIVFASRYGNMGVTFDLLVLLAKSELLSPAKFSISVHNAAAGAASQIVVNRAGHIAIAAGVRTLAAGLTETWTRIRTGRPSVIFVYSDLPLMAPYDEFDEAGPGVQLAVRLVASDNDGSNVADGRIGAEEWVRALASGAEGLTWQP